MARKKPQKTQPRKRRTQEAFLAAYAECGTITHAAKAAKINECNHFDWMKTDDTYPQRFREAQNRASDALVREARRRAVDGWKEPVFHQGIQCGVKRRYSNTLLIFLLKAALPEQYGDKQTIAFRGGVKEDTVSDKEQVAQLDLMEKLGLFNRQSVLERLAAADGNGHT